MKQLKTSLITILFFGISIIGHTQYIDSSGTRFHRNAIHGSLGNGGLYFSATLYYERMLKEDILGDKFFPFIQAGYGAEAHWEGDDRYIFARFGVLYGANTNHLELGVGPNFFLLGEMTGAFPVAGLIGWRIQKPNGNLIVRTGVALPEAFYLGLGISI